MEEKILEFLKEYEKLCQKYDMGISSCGCCGSPYIRTEDNFISDIYYNEESKCITLEFHYDKTGDYVPYTLDEYIKKEGGKE